MSTVRIPYAGGFGVREVEVPGPFKTLRDIKTVNRARRIRGLQGGEYWGPQEVRFFDAKTERKVIQGRFVIDSRQFHGENGYTAPREYSVCMVSDDGEVEKIAFPPENWNGEKRGPNDDELWKDDQKHFSSAENAKLALKLFLAGVTK